MSRDRQYPDEPAGPFGAPPIAFEDREGRAIEVRPLEADDDAGREALVEMYTQFDPSDRAQGIPPGEESRIRSWLDQICGPDCLNVVAWDVEADPERAAGHATLVPDDEAYELAIFVLQAYQRAGIGTRLMEALLGHGAAHGVEKVWLTVERWNHAAVALYEKLGFETTDAQSFEKEMAIRIGPAPAE